MRNLVLGSQGFVGKELCNYIIAKGEKVIGVDIKITPHHDLRYCKIDNMVDGVDRVWFLAWDVGGANYLYRPDTQTAQLSNNLAILCNVMPQLEQMQIPFVFASSQLAQDCNLVYGVTKRLGEAWVDTIGNGFSVRFWNIYGGYEDVDERSHVVGDMLHQAVKGNAITLQTTGKEKRQFIHARDAFAAMYAGFEQNLTGVYDVTSFEWITILNVATVISRLTGVRVIAGDKAGQERLHQNIAKIPGWQPKIPLDIGIKNTLDKFAHHDHYDA